MIEEPMGIEEMYEMMHCIPNHHEFSPDQLNVEYDDSVFAGRSCGYFDANAIILPNKQALRNAILYLYRRMNKIIGLDLPEEEKRSELQSYYEEIEYLVYACRHFDVCIYVSKYHERRHFLNKQRGIDVLDERNEGTAIADGFKMALIGIKIGQLPLQETIEVVRNDINRYKNITSESDRHKKSFAKVLGPDFDIPENPDKSQLDELILELNQKIIVSLAAPAYGSNSTS